MRRPPVKVAVTAALQVAIPVGIAATTGYLVSADSNVMTFAVLTTMLSLGFARIAAGPIRRQLRAMTVFVIMGGLIVLGIGAVDLALIPSLIIFAAVAFGAILIGAASSYAGALGRVLLILMLMATALPSGLSDGLYRWAGMVLGGIIVVVSGLVLDRFAHQPGLTAATAGVLDATADAMGKLASPVSAVAADSPDPAQLHDSADDPDFARLRGQAMAAQQQMISTPLAVLPVAHNERSLIAVSRTIPAILSAGAALAQTGPLSQRQQGLVKQAADVVTRSARVLRGQAQGATEVRGLDALSLMLASDQESSLPADVVATPQREWLVRSLVEASIVTGRLAVETVAKTNPRETVGMFFDRMRRQFTRESIYFQNAVRTCIGVALALLFSFWVGTPEPWIVITPIMVLATSYRATFINSVYVVGGVVVGVVISVPVLTLVGSSDFAQLALIPAAVFLALFATMYIHVAVGNMFFALFFLTMQHIGSGAEVVGMAEGRAFQTSVGGLIGVLVALLVWQRGAAGKIISATAKVLSASSTYAVGELARTGTTSSDASSRSRNAELALENLDDLLGQYAREQPSPALPFASVMSLASVAQRPYFVGKRVEHRQRMAGAPATSRAASDVESTTLAELGDCYTSAARRVASLTAVSGSLSTNLSSTAARLNFACDELVSDRLNHERAQSNWVIGGDRKFAVAELSDTLADVDGIVAEST
ncbi:MAG: putative membrane protein YccC [Actinomycetes bacterium]|jgi:uncharacterized membrane protein YccC